MFVHVHSLVHRKEDGLFATSLQVLRNTSSLERQTFVDIKHRARGLLGRKKNDYIILLY